MRELRLTQLIKFLVVEKENKGLNLVYTKNQLMQSQSDNKDQSLQNGFHRLKFQPIYKKIKNKKSAFMRMCQVLTKAFMQSALKWHAQKKKNEYNLKTNVEDTKFSNFFSHKS